MVVGISAVLLRACGVALPFIGFLPSTGWNFCPAPPQALAAEAQRSTELSQRARELELEIMR
ncbi:MAG: hypothetical protein NTV97_06740, partial [Alphaproteobacteria bacterium]|nr:hypothetical protein [Alphaproteobacteria bacterium]